MLQLTRSTLFLCVRLNCFPPGYFYPPFSGLQYNFLALALDIVALNDVYFYILLLCVVVGYSNLLILFTQPN